MRFIGTSLAVIAATAFAPAATAAVSFTRASAYAIASGGFGPENDVDQQNIDTMTFPAATVTATGLSTATNATGSYRAEAAGYAAFTNAGEGVLTFNVSADVTALDGAPSTVARGRGGATYLFAIDRRSRIDLAYSIERSVSPLSPPPAATIALSLRDINGNAALFLSNSHDFSGDGALNYLLDPGNYRLDFANYVNTALTRIQSGSDGESLAGRLDFGINAVPEPATWAAMSLGFGMIGAAARRRRLRTA